MEPLESLSPGPLIARHTTSESTTVSPDTLHDREMELTPIITTATVKYGPSKKKQYLHVLYLKDKLCSILFSLLQSDLLTSITVLGNKTTSYNAHQELE